MTVLLSVLLLVMGWSLLLFLAQDCDGASLLL